LMVGMALGSVVGVAVGFWAYLDTRYREGMNGWPGREAFETLQAWLTYAPGPDAATTAFMGVGFGVVAGLTFLRHRFLWWSLYPAAYPLASSLNWTMSWMWASIFVSWALKWALLRQGGLPMYRRATPFFFGLILGDYAVGGLWDVWGVLTNRYLYTFWH
ncbi:MAG: hypothetical protein O3A46_15275, partial [Candidatus Poribacteria bacterium]|nr:hypothetical protein [Candidatus Poribacteria bacterium]